jgi:hypothetical protein
MLEQNNFLENEDFKLRNVPEFKSKGGRSNNNEYYLYPEHLKFVLYDQKILNYIQIIILEESIY